MSEIKNINDNEIPVGEIRQQIEYARVISGDLFNLFAGRNVENIIRCSEYADIGLKLSMILDFLFEAKVWCDVIENKFPCVIEESEDEE